MIFTTLSRTPAGSVEITCTSLMMGVGTPRVGSASDWRVARFKAAPAERSLNTFRRFMRLSLQLTAISLQAPANTAKRRMARADRQAVGCKLLLRRDFELVHLWLRRRALRVNQI